MRYFELTKPRYDTDYASKRANPVKRINRYSVPSIQCPFCENGQGSVWACFDHLPLPLPDDARLYELLRPTILPLEDNIAVRHEVAGLMGLDFELIKPGMAIGLPNIEIANSEFGEFVHPFPGIVICRDRPKTMLEQHRVSGVRFVPVKVNWKSGKGDSEDLPALWQLHSLGEAWRVGDDLENTTICNKCGRRAMPQRGHMHIDESRYDGSDVFTVDGFANKVFVTETVRNIVDENGFTNVVCSPVL